MPFLTKNSPFSENRPFKTSPPFNHQSIVVLTRDDFLDLVQALTLRQCCEARLNRRNILSLFLNSLRHYKLCNIREKKDCTTLDLKQMRQFYVKAVRIV